MAQHDHGDHNHDHGHDDHDHAHQGRGHHDHGHHHGPANFGTAFAIGASANLAFVAAEVIFGLRANSVALLADAAHNMADVLALMLSWVAATLGRRLPSARRTYGWGRTTILAALINASVLLIGVGAIALEAVQRFATPEPVVGTTVAWVAAVGIAINLGTALLFARGAGDLNVRAAFLHLLADAAVSAGVVLSAVLIGITGANWIDPATSLVIAGVILAGTWGVMRQAVNLSVDGVPDHVAHGDVLACLSGLEGVSEVHDLHIWGISTTSTALTAHLVAGEADAPALISRAMRELAHRFAIDHVTLQVETPELAACCPLRPDHVV